MLKARLRHDESSRELGLQFRLVAFDEQEVVAAPFSNDLHDRLHREGGVAGDDRTIEWQ